MKSILVTTFFCIITLVATSQVKVNSNGKTMIGNTAVIPTAQLEVNTSANPAGTELFKVSDLTNGNFAVSEGASGAVNFLPVFRFDGNVPGFPAAFLGRTNSDVFSAVGAANTFVASTQTGAQVANTNTFMVRNGPAPQMTMTGFGKLGIGTTSPAEKLHVIGNILASGSVTGMSDRRLKKNINDYTKGLQEILMINPVTYQYNGKGGILDTESKHVGIVAQEFQNVSPESIKPVMLEENLAEIIEEATSYTKSNNHDITGGDLPKIKHNEYLSVNDKAITYMLVNAIQEQQEMIEAQSSLIDDLTSKMEKLLAGNTNTINAELEAHSVAKLGDAFPNPTNNISNIEYVIPQDASNSLMNVYDKSGRLIKSINIDHIGPGSLRLNAGNVPSGIYTYQLTVDGNVTGSKKVVVTK